MHLLPAGEGAACTRSPGTVSQASRQARQRGLTLAEGGRQEAGEVGSRSPGTVGSDPGGAGEAGGRQ